MVNAEHTNPKTLHSLSLRIFFTIDLPSLTTLLAAFFSRGSSSLVMYSEKSCGRQARTTHQ